MGFLISQYHSTNKQQTEEQFDNLKKEKIMTFESLLNRINKRFISMKFISPFVSNFYRSVDSSCDDLSIFYRNAENMTNKQFKSKIKGLNDFSIFLRSENEKVLQKEARVFTDMNKMQVSMMLLKNNLTNSKNSIDTMSKMISNLEKESSKLLDDYVNTVNKFLANVSRFRNDSIALAKSLVMSLADSPLKKGIDIVKDTFCQKDIIEGEKFKDKFKDINESFINMTDSFNLAKNESEFPSSFLKFAADIFPFQQIDFIQLKAAIDSYRKSDKYDDNQDKKIVQVAIGIIDFDYLYEISKHIGSLLKAREFMLNSNLKQDTPEDEKDGGNNE